MEYAQQTSAQNMMWDRPAMAVKPTPQLCRLKGASERIARATNNIDDFLVRFNGVAPQAGAVAGELACDNYRNDLDSLFNALDQLESAVSSLEHIG